MKTEVKMGLALGAGLLAIITAAYVFGPAKGTGTDPLAIKTPTGGTATTPQDVTTRPASALDTLTPPSTQPVALTTPLEVGISPSTQPSFALAPTTQPMLTTPNGMTGGLTHTTPHSPGAGMGTGTGAAGTTPGGPTDWNALLAGASTSTGTSGGTVPPISGTRFGTNPPGSGLSALTPPARPSLTSGLPTAGASGTTATGSTTYTIKKGDTLSSISSAVYGNRNLWAKIAAANPSVNPNRLKNGALLTIPAHADAKPSEAAAVNPKAESPSGSSLVRDPKTEYQVQSGDSLEKIAKKLYGNGARWEEIYTLNKAAIGASPTKLKIGQILKLPTAPSRVTTNPA